MNIVFIFFCKRCAQQTEHTKQQPEDKSLKSNHLNPIRLNATIKVKFFTKKKRNNNIKLKPFWWEYYWIPAEMFRPKRWMTILVQWKILQKPMTFAILSSFQLD